MHTLIIQTGGSQGENMNIHLHPMQIIKGSLRTWVWSQRLSQLNYTHSPQTLIHPVYPKCLWLAVGMGLQTRGDLRNTCTILDISAQGHRIRLAHPQTGARSWHKKWVVPDRQSVFIISFESRSTIMGWLCPSVSYLATYCPHPTFFRGEWVWWQYRQQEQLPPWDALRGRRKGAEHTQIGFSQLNNLNKTLECGSPGLEQEGLATPGSSRYL